MYLLLGPIIVVSTLTLPVIEPVTSVHPIAILKPSGVPDDFGTGFGYSVAISGDFIAVGAPHAPWSNGDMIGAVHVYQRVGPHWVERTMLTGSDAQYMAQMGWSLDMEGDTIVAGAPVWEPASCEFRQQGAAYVFVQDSNDTPHDSGDDIWIEQAKLTAPLLEHGRGFGSSVAIKGDLIVVGSECGESAEVFHRSNGKWGHLQTLVGSDTEQSDQFGYSVSMDEQQRILVGAPRFEEQPGTGGGLAYLFINCAGTWIEEAQIIPKDQQGVAFFGQSVSLDDKNVVIGAPGTTILPNGYGAGVAYPYTESKQDWIEEPRLTSLADRRPGEFGTGFGSQVSIDDEIFLVGIFGYPWGYIFKFGQDGSLTVREKLFGDDFPYQLAVDLNDDYAVISGWVYVIRNRQDISDFAAFQNCLGSVPNDDSCARFDLDDTGPLDFDSFSRLLAGFGGP